MFLKQQTATSKFNEDCYGKSLQFLPSFTIKETEQHRLKCGETPETATSKTAEKKSNVNVIC